MGRILKCGSILLALIVLIIISTVLDGQEIDEVKAKIAKDLEVFRSKSLFSGWYQ